MDEGLQHRFGAEPAHATANVGPRAWRALEFAGLFVGLPLLFRYRVLPIPLMPALWILAAACLLALLVSPRFDRRRLWNGRHLGPRTKRAVWPLALAAPAIAAWVGWFAPERLFAFPRERPGLWLVVMLLYPVLSAYPQGIVYRVFVFHRYRALFPGRAAMVVASAGAFALAHVVFQNWLAPAFSFVGGLLFAWTYARTQSGLVAAIQHALFGCWIFTSGLGWYFFYGAIRAGGTP